MHLNPNIVAITVAVLLAGLNSAMAEAGDWQLALLFDPPPSQLEREDRGRVMIYQGLTDRTVERALAEEFDRVEHMMFVSTVVTDEQGHPRRDGKTGEVLVEDDGC